MARKAIIVANWKMYLSVSRSVELARDLVAECKRRELPVIIAPSTVALAAVAPVVGGSTVQLAAQNAAWTDYGPLTGETALQDLKELGCQYVIVGHSERRHQAGESNQLCANRALHALRSGLKVIFCVGERATERARGETDSVLEQQLLGLLEARDSFSLDNLIIAYEPVWAIGTGDAASPRIADAAHQSIRNLFSSPDLPVLYGGSVGAANISSYLALPSVSGALIGGASTELGKLREILALQ